MTPTNGGLSPVQTTAIFPKIPRIELNILNHELIGITIAVWAAFALKKSDHFGHVFQSKTPHHRKSWSQLIHGLIFNSKSSIKRDQSAGFPN